MSSLTSLSVPTSSVTGKHCCGDMPPQAVYRASFPTGMPMPWQPRSPSPRILSPSVTHTACQSFSLSVQFTAVCFIWLEEITVPFFLITGFWSWEHNEFIMKTKQLFSIFSNSSSSSLSYKIVNACFSSVEAKLSYALLTFLSQVANLIKLEIPALDWFYHTKRISCGTPEISSRRMKPKISQHLVFRFSSLLWRRCLWFRSFSALFLP